MTWFPDLPAWLKISTTSFATLALIAAVLVFAPDGFLNSIGALEFVDRYRIYIGIVFLAASAFVVVRISVELGKHVVKQVRWRVGLRRARRRLHELSPEEVRVLAGYVLADTRTQYLRVGDGVVSGLVSAGIIYLASNIGLPGGLYDFAYNIQPWALKYLKAHPELLEPAKQRHEVVQPE